MKKKLFLLVTAIATGIALAQILKLAGLGDIFDLDLEEDIDV